MNRSPTDSPTDDIAFLRALAEAGRDVPLVCGPYFLMAGCVFSLASFAAFGVTLSAAPPAAITGIWLGAGVIYAILASHLNRRTVTVAGATATINQAISTIWMGLGWGIAAMFAGSAILAWRFDNALIWAAFPSTMLAVYASGWAASAFIARKRWLKLVTVGAFCASILTAMTTGSRWTFLVYGLLLLLLLALPGGILVRRQARNA
jgi:hypothetical protein